jgi:hypothetical protein
MSTKHHEGSAASKPIVLDQYALKWLAPPSSKQPDKLFFTPYAVSSNIVIRIHSRYVKNITQIQHIDVSELPISQLTRIPELGIAHADSKTNTVLGYFDELSLAVSGVGVHLSAQVLTYLKEHSYGTGKGYIEFTLKKWNIANPVFIIPRKGDNIMEFYEDVKGFVEPGKDTISAITKYRTRSKAVAELVAVLKRRLNKSKGQEFNIIQAEIFCRGMMMVNPNLHQYELPHPSQDFHFASLSTVLLHRNLSSMLAYQEQHTALLDLHWQMKEQKTRHMLDMIITKGPLDVD